MVSVKGGEATWDLNLMQNSRILKSYSGEGSLDKDLIWNLSEEQNTLPVNEDPVKIELLVKDKKRDKIIVAKGELPVILITSKQKSSIYTEDKRIDKYSLILFDYAKSRLNEGNLDVISMIKGNIGEESKVIITGYTDIIGNEDFNMKLSGKRAEETRQALGTNNVEIFAMGNTKQLYNNSLPEGRFYCRTVEIVIETPIAKSSE
jgi:outer membrane protein OmpA-like peptidoglycan-associated protein